MKSREWTDEEIEYIRLNYIEKTLWEMGQHVGVAPCTVRNKLHEIGLRPVNKRRKAHEWSKEELNYLRERFATESASDIADVLGVSAPLVAFKARELGLQKAPGWNKQAYRNRYVNNYSGNRKVA